jgi:hypothetical protein
LQEISAIPRVNARQRKPRAEPAILRLLIPTLHQNQTESAQAATAVMIMMAQAMLTETAIQEMNAGA